jgi:hypothetical protein
MKTVTDQFAGTLAAVGVKRICGIVGDSLNGLTEAIRRQGKIAWVHIRREEVTAFAAGAEAHLTGDLAVRAGSCGPGNLHLTNGLFDCRRSRAPVLAPAHIITRLPAFFALMKLRVMLLAVFTAIVGLMIAPGHLDPLPGFSTSRVRCRSSDGVRGTRLNRASHRLWQSGRRRDRDAGGKRRCAGTEVSKRSFAARPRQAAQSLASAIRGGCYHPVHVTLITLRSATAEDYPGWKQFQLDERE